MIAPMDIELKPIVRSLGLIEILPNEWRGKCGPVEVVATMSSIGMEAARIATAAMLRHDVDHMMIVGISGAISESLKIGSVIAPAVVVDRVHGRSFVPTLGSAPHCQGTLSCGDDLITDTAVLAALASDGVIALDMESAGVGEVCEETGTAWSVWRAISDHSGGGMIDTELFAMTKPDGTADQRALQRALDDPARRANLERLARDANLAVEAAAAVAIAAITHFAS